MASYFGPESSAVQTHIKIMQDVIQRMAAASRQCKLQCIIAVSLGFVAIVSAGQLNYIEVLFVPIGMFLILDTYYLAQEKCFRYSYDSFVKKLKQAKKLKKKLNKLSESEELKKKKLKKLKKLRKLILSQLYEVKPTGSMPITFFKSLISSWSILIFYPPLFITILRIKVILFEQDFIEVVRCCSWVVRCCS